MGFSLQKRIQKFPHHFPHREQRLPPLPNTYLTTKY